MLTLDDEDVKSFMHAKTIPNAVTIATGKISHTGTSSFLPELNYLQSILPKEQWKVSANTKCREVGETALADYPRTSNLQ